MNLDAIRSFLHVAEAGSFSLAATRLEVMQSTISGRIQTLEDELGCVLFRRGRGGAELTPAGLDFRAHAEQIIQTWDQARHDVALPPGFTATLRLGGPVAIQDELTIAWALWMKKHASSVALQLESGSSDLLIHALVSRTMDAAIMYLPRQRSGLIVEELLRENLALVKHPAMSGEWQQNFIMIDWGYEFKVNFSRAFPAVPAPPISIGPAALALRYLLALKGAAYLPLSLTQPLIADGTLERVDGAPVFKRPVYLVYPAQARDPDLLSLALGGLRTVVAEMTRGKSAGARLARAGSRAKSAKL